MAGKDIWCEWPLGASLSEAQELLTLANQQKIKTAIGLQAIFSPHIRKIKELVDAGRIGKVLSSTFVGNAGYGGGTIGEAIRYFTDREVGGNVLSIHFGHSIEYVLSGEFMPTLPQIFDLE